MPTNVYLPETDNRLQDKGFRWCRKDCRWESKTSLSELDAEELADELGVVVQVKSKGRDWVFNFKPGILPETEPDEE